MAPILSGRGAGRAFLISALRECEFLRRSPWDLALATWLPCLCLAALAWLLSSAVPRGLPIAVVDEDRSAMSRELIRMLDAAPAIEVAAQPSSLSSAWSQARSLEAYAVVYIPRDLSREVARAGQGTLFGFYNASYPSGGPTAVRDVSSVVQAFGSRVAWNEVALNRGPRVLKAPPIAVQVSLLFNSTSSYEYYLLALLLPAVLHLALCLSVVGALGRELRDGTAGAWLQSSGDALVPAVVGKVSPYVLLFTAQGCASLLWLTVLRGNEVHGSASLLVLGHVLLYAAYASMALLLIGATKTMGTALSLATLYAGTSLAFSGATFPIEGASLFARIWNLLLPFTAYVGLQAEQMQIGSPWTTSLKHFLVLMLFVAVPGALGLRLYGRAARDPAMWGRR